MQENKRPSCTQALLSMAPENDLRQFVDRDREIRYFIECLYKIATGELNNSVIVLHGMPCVGKRSLLTLLRKITDTYGRERRRIYEQLEMSITSSELFEPRCKTIHLLLRDSDTLLSTFSNKLMGNSKLKSVEPYFKVGVANSMVGSETSISFGAICEIQESWRDNFIVQKVKSLNGRPMLVFVEILEEPGVENKTGNSVEHLQGIMRANDITNVHFILALNDDWYNVDRVLQRIATMSLKIEMLNVEQRKDYLKKIHRTKGIIIDNQDLIYKSFNNMNEFKQAIINGGRTA